jgi:hypothetical protein
MTIRNYLDQHTSGAVEYVDYLVLKELPLGDFDQGAHVAGGLYLLPVTEGVLRSVERALHSNEP